jgi:hypothetical protein
MPLLARVETFAKALPTFDESVTARVSTLTALLVPLLAFAQHAPPAQPFQRFDGCLYKPQRWNDGDSFHVISR